MAVFGDLETYFDRLWPICRSITGPGYRESLDILSELMPNERLKFPSGKEVFDWNVPKEWLIRDAYIVGPDGKKYAEFKKNNLHILNYSSPFKGKMPLSDLQEHLHSLPDLPKAVPYMTTYYKERWGFCLSHEERQKLTEGLYEVMIDSELKNGHLEIGEAVILGESNEEILFTSYLCHPSMANNELSGPLVLSFLYREILAMPKRHYTYRFAIVPETIGALCYLSARGDHFIKNLLAGYVITCVGIDSAFTYKRSRRGDSVGDLAAEQVLKDHGKPSQVIPFDPSAGSDERQYCSPGFNLPVGSLMRAMYAQYPEYHTSLDNKSKISFDAMKETVQLYTDIVRVIESNKTWINKISYGEPQLGKRGLYPTLGSQKVTQRKVAQTLWVMNLADGKNDLLSIARISGQPMKELIPIAEELALKGLLVTNK